MRWHHVTCAWNIFKHACVGALRKGKRAWQKIATGGKNMDRGDRITDKVLHTVLYHRRTEMESKKKKGLGKYERLLTPFSSKFYHSV